MPARSVRLGPFLAAYLTIFDHWHLLTYWRHSKTLAWVTTLPVWLMGCALAQAIATRRLSVLPESIWVWRIGAVLLSILPKALVYHSVTPILIRNPATLGVYAVFAFFWVSEEIQFYRDRPPPAVLGWGGRWSHSIYLVPNIVLVVFAHQVLHRHRFALWPTELAAVLSLSYILYRLIEHPAHWLARVLGQSLAHRHALGGYAMGTFRTSGP